MKTTIGNYLMIILFISAKAFSQNSEDESDKYTQLGAGSFENKDYSNAIIYFKKALGTAYDYKAYNNIGLAFYWSDNIDSAIFYSRKSSTLNKDYYSAWGNLYQCYYDKGDIKHFVECYGEALRLDHTKTIESSTDVSHDYDAMKEIVQNPTAKNSYELGDVYFNKEDYIKAKGLYEQTLKIDPNYGKALFQMGIINLQFTKAPNLDKALGYFKKASLAMKSDLDNVYENIGLCYEKKKDYTNAIANYKKALTFDPGDFGKSIFYKLGRTYEAMGDRKNANYYKSKS